MTPSRRTLTGSGSQRMRRPLLLASVVIAAVALVWLLSRTNFGARLGAQLNPPSATPGAADSERCRAPTVTRSVTADVGTIEATEEVRHKGDSARATARARRIALAMLNEELERACTDESESVALPACNNDIFGNRRCEVCKDSGDVVISVQRHTPRARWAPSAVTTDDDGRTWATVRLAGPRTFELTCSYRRKCSEALPPDLPDGQHESGGNSCDTARFTSRYRVGPVTGYAEGQDAQTAMAAARADAQDKLTKACQAQKMKNRVAARCETYSSCLAKEDPPPRCTLEATEQCPQTIMACIQVSWSRINNRAAAEGCVAGCRCETGCEPIDPTATPTE